ncbi:hypothetical protein RCL1_002984 [Eukaryota sp. TZLM3-RCL]
MQTSVIDDTSTDVVSFRKLVFTTITSTVSFEEACHKLLAIPLPKSVPDPYFHLCKTILDTCVNFGVFSRSYPLIAKRLISLSKTRRPCFAAFSKLFQMEYESEEQVEVNKIISLAKFFGHLITPNDDTFPLDILKFVFINSSSTAKQRIFLKHFFIELVDLWPRSVLVVEFSNKDFQEKLPGIFPRDSLDDLKYVVQFFKNINLEFLADSMKTELENIELRLRREIEEREIEEQSSRHRRISTHRTGQRQSPPHKSLRYHDDRFSPPLSPPTYERRSHVSSRDYYEKRSSPSRDYRNRLPSPDYDRRSRDRDFYLDYRRSPQSERERDHQRHYDYRDSSRSPQRERERDHQRHYDYRDSSRSPPYKSRYERSPSPPYRSRYTEPPSSVRDSHRDYVTTSRDSSREARFSPPRFDRQKKRQDEKR